MTTRKALISSCHILLVIISIRFKLNLFSGLQLSLQSQTVLFVQSFHETHRQQLSTALESETWKRTTADQGALVNRLVAIPALREIFSVNGD